MSLNKEELFEKAAKTEMAIRGLDLVRNKTFADFDAGATSLDDVAEKYARTFIEAHTDMCQNSSQFYKKVRGAVFQARHMAEEDVAHLKEIFYEFAAAHYNNDGTVNQERAGNITRNLQQLFDTVTQEVPLFNTEMVMGVMMNELGRGQSFSAVLPNGLDFTRPRPGSSTEERFEQAATGENIRLGTSEYLKLPHSYVEIEGVKFMTHVVNDWQTHLVTESGHLIDLTTEGPDSLKSRLAAHIRSGADLAEFELPTEGQMHLSQLIQPMIGRDRKEQDLIAGIKAQVKSLADATEIDGFERSPGASAPLCMDVDRLTGLRIDGKGNSELAEVKAFMKKHGVKSFIEMLPDSDMNIQMLPDAEKDAARATISDRVGAVMAGLKEAAGEGRMRELLERAEESLKVTLPLVWEASDPDFIKKTPDGPALKVPARERGEDPELYLTQGGTGSGKSGLVALAKRESGEDLVIAHLDNARSKSNVYALYQATDNHNEDYMKFNEFGNAIRDLTMVRAQKAGFDLLIDGSGIPYLDRNDKVIANFEKDGYNTTLLAASTPLFVDNPQERAALAEQGLAPGDSFLRTGHRLKHERRAAPTEVVLDKHIKFPNAFMNAIRDDKLDRVTMEDYSGEYGKQYTLSYAVEGTLEDIQALKGKSGQSFIETLEKRGLMPDWVKLPENPENNELDFKVVRERTDGTYRIQVITDMEQYITTIQKGLLRRDTVGPEQLLDNTLTFDVNGEFQNGHGRLELLQPKHVQAEPWPHYAKMAQTRPVDGQGQGGGRG